ncbi:MAG: mevalonate kinase [Planctomycetes bacterium]|nr:mevalonate kinase [Planctomycetota bacterium]
MPAITASSPGKVILFGEHAVVYERPAIAVPVAQVKTKVTILAEPQKSSGSVQVEAPDIGLHTSLDNLPADDPLVLAICSTQGTLNLAHLPAMTIRITSTIPVAAGLGSGAAVSVALVRALSAFLGHPLSDDKVSTIAYQVEKKHHGNPSGIDNTVITYAQPVFFTRGQPFELLPVAEPFTLVIADSGIKSPTILAVADVRKCWQENPVYFDSLFDKIGEISRQERGFISKGPCSSLGPLMTANQNLLKQIGVSCPELDLLVATALDAGALGAKLSGSGRGGNMIALVAPELAGKVSSALSQAGAARILVTLVHHTQPA